MPRTPMTDIELEEIKKQILDTAFSIVYNDGFSNLSMRKIASRLGMTAANIYNYYANKDELNIEMRRYSHILLYDRLTKAYERAKNTDEKIRFITQEFVSFAIGNPNYYELMFNMPTPKYSDYVGTPMEELATRELTSSLRNLELVKKVTLEFVEDGGVMLRDLNKTVLIILSYLHGIITLYNNKLLQYLDEDPDKTVQFLVSAIIEIILHLKNNNEVKEFIHVLEKGINA